MKTFLFPNLFAQIITEETARANENKNTVSKFQTTDELDEYWIKQLLPKSKKIDSFKSLEDAKSYILSRIDKKLQKTIKAKREKLEAVSDAPEFHSMEVSVEWSRSYNPRANGRDGYGVYDSGLIGGAGYDKLSTAVAEVLNQSNSLLKLLYIEKENSANVLKKNHDLFGYGSGYGLLPAIEGGVGVSCYDRIFEKVGVTFRKVAYGKNFDAYILEKK
jgi:hypothetical protein